MELAKEFDIGVVRLHGLVVFFFSSRRRHTRSKRDWSSDVCSSDLPGGQLRFSIAHFSVKQRSPLRKSFIPSRRQSRHFAIRILANVTSPLSLVVYTRQIGRASCRERVVCSVCSGSSNNQIGGVSYE